MQCCVNWRVFVTELSLRLTCLFAHFFFGTFHRNSITRNLVLFRYWYSSNRKIVGFLFITEILIVFARIYALSEHTAYKLCWAHLEFEKWIAQFFPNKKLYYWYSCNIWLYVNVVYLMAGLVANIIVKNGFCVYK